jgi:hypothetical protein
VAVACQHCGSALDVSRPEVELITRYTDAVAALLLPLGARGTLGGVEWEVVGYLERTDGDADWSEYLLFNPYAGYRWLVHSGNDWQVGTPLLGRPDVLSESDVYWQGGRFVRDYDPAATETIRVVGEFYWRVERGSTVTASTFSGYQTSLSSEWNADEVSWTQLVAVHGRDVLAAFKVAPADGGGDDGGGKAWDTEPSVRFGGPIDGSYPHGSGLFGRGFRMAFVTMAASLVVFALTWVGVGSGDATNTLVLEIGGAPKNAVIGTVQVDKPNGFVVIDARSTDFTNKWVDLDYSLINLDTQQAYTGYDTLEHYTGRDSDGAWSEGSTELTTRFGSIPRGRYEVVVDAGAHSWGSGSSNDGQYNGWAGEPPLVVTFRARPAGMYLQDLLMVAGPLLLVPLIMALLTLQFRSGRE